MQPEGPEDNDPVRSRARRKAKLIQFVFWLVVVLSGFQTAMVLGFEWQWGILIALPIALWSFVVGLVVSIWLDGE